MKTSNWPGGKLPGRTVNEAGNSYGKLAVINYVGSNERNEAMWRCSCLCGNDAYVSGPKLRKGHTRSCGCLVRETVTQRNNKHEMHDHPLYALWAGVKARCTNTSHASYKHYGGRGIKMCPQWANDFSKFVQDMGPRPDGASIDRVDPNGDYEPSNCRWASKKEQANNKRDNHLVTHQGKTQTLAMWAEETGVPYSTLCNRINKQGWPKEKALDRFSGLITHNGKSQTLSKWASDFGIKYTTLHQRINRSGMSIEKALNYSQARGSK